MEALSALGCPVSTSMKKETDDATGMKYAQAPLVPQPHPWLVAIHGKQRQKQTFYSVSERRYYVRTIPELRNHSIRACCDGWLVLVLNELENLECCLLNLVSKERIQLPTLNPDMDSSWCVLLSPPTDHDSRVVFLKDKEGTEVTIYYCKPGDTKFASKTFSINEELESPMALNGKIYWLTKVHSNLLVLDFNNQKPELKTLVDKSFKKENPGEVHCFESWLVASSEGELFCVYKMYFGVYAPDAFGFQIFKLDFSEEPSWIEVKRIGKNRVLFLDENWGMMCSISTTIEKCQNIKGNNIYFTQSGDRSLYVFDLEDATISFSIPFHSAHPLYNWISIPIDRV